MPLALRAQENVVYPLPYVETEEHPLIITNQRVWHRSETSIDEIPTAKVSYVGRLETKPFVPVAVALFLAALPLVAYGAYSLYTVWGMEAAPPWPLPFMSASRTDENADPNSPPPDEGVPAASGDETIDGPKEVLYARATGYGTGGLGLFFGWLGLKLIRKRRYFVLCRGENNFVIKMRAPSQMVQTQIMMTLQAVSGR